MLARTPAYLASLSRISSAERAALIESAKSALRQHRDFRLYTYALPTRSLRASLMGALRQSEEQRRLVQFGRLTFQPSRWGRVPVARKGWRPS